MRTGRILSVSGGLAVVLAVVSPALAAWEVINLHPAGAIESQAFDISAGQQVGYAIFSSDSVQRALLWNGTASDWVDLHPVGGTRSAALGISSGHQVGSASSGGISHAGFWSSSADSWVDLSPNPVTNCGALDAAGGQQVGYYFWSIWNPEVDGNHACLWNGTSGSMVDLHPNVPGPGGANSLVYDSFAVATNGSQQVGYYVIGRTNPVACMWSGTKESWVSLHPAGSWSSSAFDIGDGQQVGSADAGSTPSQKGPTHAGLWTGTAESWIDLNPTGSSESTAYGVAGGYQVGYATIDGARHAAIWNGTPQSWFDLQSLLNSDYSTSIAQRLEVSGDQIWVVGSAVNSSTSQTEAVMWHYVVPEPSSLLVIGAMLASGIGRRRRGSCRQGARRGSGTEVKEKP